MENVLEAGEEWAASADKDVSHLRRSEFSLRFFPGLPASANFFRAYGAGTRRLSCRKKSRRDADATKTGLSRTVSTEADSFY